MPRTHFYETSFEVGSKKVLVFAEYTLTSGCPAHMGSLTYPGHPAEPAELEFVKVEINTTDTDHMKALAENYFPAPEWLVTILHEDDDIYQEICSQDHEDYPEYEYDDRD